MDQEQRNRTEPVPGRESAGGLVAFFALTFAVTWTCFITAAALSCSLPAGASPGLGVRALALLGTIAPSLVALALTRRAEGGTAVRRLLGRIFQWRVSLWYYIFAIGYMAAVKLTVAVLDRLVTGSWPHFWEEPWYVMAVAITISTWVQAGEEIGWRGFALPRLAERWGLATASIVLGAIWALWHLPLFYVHGADTYGQSFPAYLLQVIAFSVAMAWLYSRTRGSLLLVMLMHASINNTKGIVPTTPRPAGNPLAPGASLMTWLGVAVVGAVAILILARMHRAGLTRPVPRERFYAGSAIV